MHFLNALDRDVEIVIRKEPRSRRGARITVARFENREKSMHEKESLSF